MRTAQIGHKAVCKLQKNGGSSPVRVAKNRMLFWDAVPLPLGTSLIRTQVDMPRRASFWTSFSRVLHDCCFGPDKWVERLILRQTEAPKAAQGKRRLSRTICSKMQAISKDSVIHWQTGALGVGGFVCGEKQAPIRC